MVYKIVSDSSSNVFAADGINYTTVPMKVIAGEAEYLDCPELDVAGMVSDLKKYKGKSGSSCPNVQEWLDAFEDADWVFGITISKNLSGSYNAAAQAAEIYMQENPGKRVYIFDSLSAGPQQMMMADKIADLIQEGCDFDTIVEKVEDYHDHCHTLFCLESLTNLARNGRVGIAAATVAGVLGIRVVGNAKGGEITPIHKPRGEKKAMQALMSLFAEGGLYDGALVRIAHCFAEVQANTLKGLVLEQFPNCRFIIEPTAALCSFYAEAGGLMIGFEGDYNEGNSLTCF